MDNERADKGSRCAVCPGTVCYPLAMVGQPLPPIEQAPDFCPMRRFPAVMETAAQAYAHPGVREFARQASIQEAQCYELTPDGIRTRIPRIEETMQFARKCGFARLGLAFCVGLKEEARLLSAIFEAQGFSVVSVSCKVGRVPKEDIGLSGAEKIMGPDIVEPLCNPIAQAEVLNAEGVDLAVMLGLCVGHDTLFLRACRVPCTVLAVKDRVTGHNPLAALYLSKGPYYRRLAQPGPVAEPQPKVVLD